MTGKSWCKCTNNVPDVAFPFIGLQKITNDLVIGARGCAGVIDAIAQLPQVNLQVLTKKS
jgi:hypothetical protein